MRLTRVWAVLLLGGSLGGGACAPAQPGMPASAASRVSPGEVRALESALADDSLEGRMTATPGSAKAAAIIAGAMREAGLAPAGDSGYYQRVPIALASRGNGRLAPVLVSRSQALDSLPPERRPPAFNVVGVLPGRDPALRDQVVLIDAHYDHLGRAGAPVSLCRAQGADSICNGADDDASGVVAALLAARALARGPGSRRTVVMAAMTGEEAGLLGTRWYIAHPVRPLERTVANLEIEMIGRPDSLAGGPGYLWLTGYQRTTLGRRLAAAGIPIVADPRPAQDFFERSDNIAFARRGIPAQAVSSFNLHGEYHMPADDLAHIDFAHMAAAVDAIARAVAILANDDDPPRWTPGGRP